MLLASSLLLVVLIGTTLAWVSLQSNRLVSARLTSDLTRASVLIQDALAERFEALRVAAELLTAFPELNALAQTDAATIRDFLLDYQRRTQRADLLALLSPQGRMMARTDAVTAADIPDVDARWIVPTLSGRPPDALLETGTATYQATAAAAEAAGNVFGFLIVGARMDDTLARRLREMTGEETLILGRGAVLGSTLSAGSLPWQSIAELTRSTPDPHRPFDLDVGGERYLALASTTPHDEGALFVSLQSRDRAMAPYRQIQAGLLIVGLIGVVVGIGASAVLARQVTTPVARLVEGTQQVASGNFDYTLEQSGIEELGTLARSFNDMTRGLRERADMQKFVSQSTVEMIKSDSHDRGTAGERRTVTIFFSDVRGFTAFSETRGPEEVVKMLNACLGLQAERIRKFGGDIDKFVGDAVVAIFEGEDMALRAIRCALDVQRAVEGLPAAGFPVAVGIGIATGEVVLGSIGGGNRFDYTAIGLHVNLAARLCSKAAAHEILLAESTWRQVEDLVAAERLVDLQVKGFSQAVPVFRMRFAAPHDAPVASGASPAAAPDS
jgi:class 3 adenylate cyclase